MKEMRILILANGDFFSTYGGGQIYVKNLVDEMILQGLNITILSIVNKPQDKAVKKGNYKTMDIYEIKDKTESVISNVIKDIQPDIIHAHAQKALVAKISKELNIPCIITAHHGGIICPAGSLMNHKDEIYKEPLTHENSLPAVLKNTKGGLAFYHFWKHIPLNLRLKIGHWISRMPFIYFITPWGISSLHIEDKLNEWKSITENATLVIAPSQAIAESMIMNGLNKEKIRIIPHGSPYNISSNESQIVDFSSRKISFFYFGRIKYVKGIHVLLKAFSQLDPDKCELHLIGDIQEKYEQQLIKEYRTNKNIRFHGKIEPENVSEYIRKFDILVHPTIYLEVFGLNIAEALLEKKPVIATKCGGAEMQIKEGYNGLLVELNNVQQLRDAMQWMMCHPEKVKMMSENAPKNVVLMSEHVKSIYEVYQTVLEK